MLGDLVSEICRCEDSYILDLVQKDRCFTKILLDVFNERIEWNLPTIYKEIDANLLPLEFVNWHMLSKFGKFDEEFFMRNYENITDEIKNNEYFQNLILDKEFVVLD